MFFISVISSCPRQVGHLIDVVAVSVFLFVGVLCRSGARLRAMGWWRHRRGFLSACAVLVAVGGALAWVLTRSTDARTPAIAVVMLVVTLVGLLGTNLPRVWGWGSRPASMGRPVEELAGLLAAAVRDQWEIAAGDRRLRAPAPIPVTWSLPAVVVSGPMRSAVGEPDGRVAFPPLPGLEQVSETDLRAGGGQVELHRLYGGLASGRLVVVGAPGAGKSAAAILLLLDALAHRDHLAEPDRSRVPIPVLFTLDDWDPNPSVARPSSLEDWLADRMAATYLFLAHRGGRGEAAALIAAGRVAVFLDGLDEVAEAMRPVVLEALSRTPMRVVLLTRTVEMAAAACTHHLLDAAAVQLDDVPGPVAASYLHRSMVGTAPPARWEELLDRLRRDPEGPLARSLSTPLTLTLLRDTYRARDDVGEVIVLAEMSCRRDDVEDHLLGRLVTVAYTPRAGQSPPCYTVEQAHRTLAFVAARMNHDGTRDLAWWHIPKWAPAAPRAIAAGLVSGLGLALLFGRPFGLVLGLAFGLPFGLLFGPLVGLVGSSQADEPKRLPRRSAVTTQAGVVALPVGLASGLVSGLIVGRAFGLLDGLVYGPVYGLALGGLWLVGSAAPGVGTPGVVGPRLSWRNDWIVGLTVGLASGLLFGLTSWWASGLVSGLMVGLAFGLLFGLVFGLLFCPSGTALLAFLQLHRRAGLPLQLMRFLEDARGREVLRTVGPLYQFRHARLQDQLASSCSGAPTLGPIAVARSGAVR